MKNACDLSNMAEEECKYKVVYVPAEM